MTIEEMIKDDLQVIEAEFNKTLNWKGEDYACIPASAGEASILEIGGFAVSVDIVLCVRRELFTDGIYPEQQQTLTYNGETYRIARVRNEPFDVFIKFDCVSDSRGA